MEIRLANPNDAALLFEMNERFNGTGSTTKELLADSIANNSQEAVFIATVDGGTAGFCCVQLFKSMCYRSCYAEITELFVEEAYRQQGVATALMGYAEDYFRDKNVKGYQLFTGKQNKIAQAFYEKNGYTPSAEQMYRKRL